MPSELENSGVILPLITNHIEGVSWQQQIHILLALTQFLSDCGKMSVATP